MKPFPVSAAAAALFEEICREVPRLELNFVARKRPAAIDRLDRLSDSDLLGSRIADESLAASVRAGLLLRADRMEESHAISQSIETPEGSYWHGILHRREPDYPNAKHWLRRVGEHPIFPDLCREPSGSPRGASEALREITRGGKWDAFRFVDLCAALSLLESRTSGRVTREAETGPRRAELEEIQAREIELLLAYCAAGAVLSRRERGGIQP